MRRGTFLLAALFGCTGDDGGSPLRDAGTETDAACLVDEDRDRHLAPSCAGDDCDDADDEVHPGAADTVGDLVDENCDGVDGIDSDGDDHASASSGGDDCDDAHAAIHPGAEEDAAWSTETVDDADITYGPSLFRTPDGALHVVYADFSDQTVRHATNASGRWELEAIAGADETGGAGDYSTAAADRSGTLHVAYTTISPELDRTLHYIAGDADGWSAPEVVDVDAQDAGYGCKLVVGADGTAYVAYWAFSATPSLMLATNAGGTWATEPVESDALHYWFFGADLAIDDQGALHLLYPLGPRDPPRALHYATNESGSWSVEAVAADGGASSAAVAALRVDAEGTVHAVFTDDVGQDMWAATRSDGTWTEERLDDVERYSLGVDLTLGDDGAVFVAYGGSPAAASVAANLGRGWILSTIEPTEASLAGVSLLLNAAGAPEVTYVEGSQSDLRFAWTDRLDQNCDGTAF